MRKSGNIPLVLPFLKAVQSNNDKNVNEAINRCYIEVESYADLRESIDSFDQFDHIGLAQQIQKHELLEFRRIAATLYKQADRYEESVELSKKDGMYKDAIDTAAASNKATVANDLISYFVDKQDAECFCATLYTCYDLIEPSVALELAWRNGFIDFAMPYLIQFIANSREGAQALQERLVVLEKAKQSSDDINRGMAEPFGADAAMGAPLALGSTAYNQPPPPPMGGGFGGPPPMGAGLGGPPPMGGGLGGPPPMGAGL